MSSDFLVFAATWFLAPLALIGLLAFFLRWASRRRARRMSRASMDQTGLGATTWDSYHGPSTVSDLPAPQSFSNDEGSSPKP